MVEQKMQQAKQTKNTVVFSAVKPGAAVTTVYVAKGTKIDGQTVEDVETLVLTLNTTV